MRKTNFKLSINKKHVILACLTLILGISVLINYSLSNTSEIQPTEVLQGIDLGDTYGEVTYVNAGEYSLYSSDDYFAQARLDKMTSRDEAVETLSMMLSGGDLSDEEITMYTESALTLSSLIQTESTVENLVKAAGYDDCVVYLDGETASIVVKTDGLTNQQAALIKEILLAQVSVPTENIRIFEVK